MRLELSTTLDSILNALYYFMEYYLEVTADMWDWMMLE